MNYFGKQLMFMSNFIKVQYKRNVSSERLAMHHHLIAGVLDIRVELPHSPAWEKTFMTRVTTNLARPPFNVNVNVNVTNDDEVNVTVVRSNQTDTGECFCIDLYMEYTYIDT